MALRPEHNAETLSPAPDHAAWTAQPIRGNLEVEVVGHAPGAWEFNQCSVGREVAHRAFDSADTELDRSAFKYPVARRRALLIHGRKLDLKPFQIANATACTGCADVS
jgi:hypothetical protein